MASKRDSFSNLNEFGAVIHNLDDYESLPSSAYRTDTRSFTNSDRVHLMVNVTQNRITMPVSKDYPVFDHKTALGYVEKELVKDNIAVHGFIDTIGDRMYARILFDDIKLSDSDSKIDLGMSFENPMDRKTRFKGYGYTWRQICTNGAGIKKLLPIMEINEKHTRNMEITVPPKIHDFVTAFLGQTNHMQTLIDKSQEIRLTFESPQQVLLTLQAYLPTVNERHIKRIAAKLEGKLEPTRWDMFNACNNYTSHSNVTPDIRSEIDRLAEQFVDVNISITPVKVEVKVQQMEDVVKRPSEYL